MRYFTSYLKKSNIITQLALLVMRYPQHWLSLYLGSDLWFTHSSSVCQNVACGSQKSCAELCFEDVSACLERDGSFSNRLLEIQISARSFESNTAFSLTTNLKGSYDTILKIIILGIWCNRIC